MENLRKLRQERQLSQQKLASEFNLSQQSIYKYENNLAEPDIQTLKKFASFFQTTVDYLIDYSPNSACILENQLNPEESRLLLLYRNLPPSTRQHLSALLEDISEKK